VKIQRKPHILSHNKAVWVPARLFFFDTESYLKKINPSTTEHLFRLGTAIYVELDKEARVKQKETYQYKTQDEFLSILLQHVKKKQPLYCFACNVWYDLRNLNLLPKLTEKGFTIISFINKSRVVIIHAKSPQGTIFFLDTLNYLPFSVRQLGEKLGLRKLQADFEKDSEQKLFKYCLRDTEIITEAILEWIQFLRHEGLGSFAKSLASQALNAFRHRFMKHRIHIHTDKKIIELERASYFGGRTECFFIGKVKESPIYDLDVNSMYPFVMWKYEYPTKKAGYLENVSIEKLKEILKKYAVIAEVELKTDKPYYPYRCKSKCLFPIGQLTTTLCTKSLVRALKNNHIVKVNKLAAYHKAVIFRDYVEYFYNLKKQAKENNKKIDYILAKLFLNSLYGKFGQRVDEIIEAGVLQKPQWGREEIIYAKTGKKEIINYLGNRYEVLELNAEDGYNTFVAIASHVTDYARNVLLDYIEMAGWDNVYYCDTDSLFVNEKGYVNLQSVLSETELGKLKLERKIKNLVIHGLKDYVYDGKVVLKGIPTNARKISDSEYEVEIFPKPLSDLREGIQKPYQTIKRVKKLKRVYNKGIVTSTGRVIPIKLP